MNNLIKNIHDQMKPRKQVTDDLLRKIEEQQTEEVRTGGLSKLWVALPAAVAVAVVCVGIFVNLGGSELETVGAARIILLTEKGTRTQVFLRWTRTLARRPLPRRSR